MDSYRILLGDIPIGTTELERADAPMGVVIGRITFQGVDSGYSFIKEYCGKNGITLTMDDAEFKCIETQVIPELRVFSAKGIEVKGVGCYLSGIDDDGFDITIYGISYPFYEEEFPHHAKAYFGTQ
jgi:predicted nucleic acid-binding Zn ribbon protein